jgi:hypothetical protein
MTILLLSPVGDFHCETVAGILRKRGENILHCDFGRFPSDFQLSSAFDRHGSQQSFLFTARGRYKLDEVTAVWDRSHMGNKSIHPVKLGMEAYIRAESRTFLDGLYYMLPKALWISPPSQVRAAEIKILQKQIAARLGFLIPDTCIGNVLELACALTERHNEMAIKSIYRTFVDYELTPWEKVKRFFYNAKNRKMLEEYRHTDWHMWDSLQYRCRQMVYTQKFTKDKAETYLADIPACPVILQEYIPKKLELRITVVGKKIFPCAIYSQEAQGHGMVDYRGHEDEVRHEVYKLPAEIEEKCFALLRELGLQYGSIDMIVTPDEEYFFLEINSNGQFLWVQEKTGMPIAEAVADLLMSRRGVFS